MNSINKAIEIIETHRERIKHTSHKDGLGMGSQCCEYECNEIINLLKKERGMRLATIEEFEEIYEIFKQYKHIFPHIRTDYLKRMILSGNMIYQDGVVITFNQYKHRQRQGHLHAQRDDFVLKQIATSATEKGVTRKVMTEFFEWCSPFPVWLSVRTDNARARAFYVKMGMEETGTMTWAKGTLPGTIYRYTPPEVPIFDKAFM